MFLKKSCVSIQLTTVHESWGALADINAGGVWY